MEEILCVCGSGQTYLNCCQLYHQAHKLPASAEILMRSRYSAFVLGKVDYLKQTWCEQTRPGDLELDQHIEWIKLEIINTQAGGMLEQLGEVEFKAYYRVKGGQALVLHEISQFQRQKNGAWCYLDGRFQS